MNDEGRELLTIGQLSRRTGLSVRTIRYWSDIGALPPDGRTSAGFRLYGTESVARLQLVRTLRELGLGHAEVRRVVRRETTVAAVAAVHVRALDAQIRALRLSRAVLSTVARRQSDTEEMELMNKLARLSAQERAAIIEDFVDEVFSGLDADPQLYERMRSTMPGLPDDPTPEQVDAWIELAELVTDPDFRRRMRHMVRHNATGRTQTGPGRQPGAFMFFAKKVALLVGAARERGVAPESAEAAGVLDELLGTNAGAPRRAEVLERVEAGLDAQAERYWQLMALIRGEQPRPTTTPDYQWLARSLRAHG
ncbi:MerR family transcriptional regulator [Streptosporangium sp. 'caverna']|uniref:helix-turn-helix domain-containing protein n=1 Tax=Streptosporangium sp. 'caverna' TaxID=2202249 RepID=UPI000D7E7AB2|nr:MerR family transcriptional regulator [Streptosporangium sp. 'caverna']AWS45129.1 MerR family transcriptional regulator [Streptosporangium sp. 'caverna']